MPESLQTLDGVTERSSRKPPDSDNSFIAHARIHELKTIICKKKTRTYSLILYYKFHNTKR